MGRITDEIGEPIMFARVVLNSIPIIGALSDDEGRFSLNDILPGKYDIEISSLRYETSVIEDVIVKKGDNIELRIEVILEDEVQDLKPIIYIHPEDTAEVQVNLDYGGRLTTTYPSYSNGWNVTACPDGTLIDEKGRQYYALYWEGIQTHQIQINSGTRPKS